MASLSLQPVPRVSGTIGSLSNLERAAECSANGKVADNQDMDTIIFNYKYIISGGWNKGSL